MTTELQQRKVASRSEDSIAVDQEDQIIFGTMGGVLGGLFAYALAPVRRLGPWGRLMMIPISPLPYLTLLGVSWLTGSFGAEQSLENVLPRNGLGDLIQVIIAVVLLAMAVASPAIFLAGLWATARTLGESIQKNGTSPLWAETLVLLTYFAVLIGGGMLVVTNN